MMPSAPGPRFHEEPRDGMPVDVGLFWERDAHELERLLRDSEVHGTARLAQVEEIWADRSAWIDRYRTVEANQNVLARERDALLVECETLRNALVEARNVRDGERAHATAERGHLLAMCAALRDNLAAVGADREAVREHRDALAADRDVQAAAREAAESRAAAAEAALAAPHPAPWRRLVPAPLRRIVRRLRRV